MKLCNIQVGGAVHLGLVTERGVVDATAAGCPLCMDPVIAGADRRRWPPWRRTRACPWWPSRSTPMW